MDAPLLVERRGRTLLVTLNRPQVRNAVNRAMSQAIADAMDMLDESDELVVGILTGTGGNFSSGMDLKAFLQGERPEVGTRGFAGLTESPPRKLLIAAVEGWALAGGFEVVLTCDLVVAARNAAFGLPEVQRGLIAGSGGLVRMPSKLPRSVAMHHAVTGDPLAAEDAHRWGLVTMLTEPGAALSTAISLAERIADNSPRAVQTTKKVIDEAIHWPASERWARQRQYLDWVLASDDAREGAAAFAERRAPRWR